MTTTTHITDAPVQSNEFASEAQPQRVEGSHTIGKAFERLHRRQMFLDFVSDYAGWVFLIAAIVVCALIAGVGQ